MGRIKKLVQQEGPEGIYVKSLMFGSNFVAVGAREGSVAWRRTRRRASSPT